MRADSSSDPGLTAGDSETELGAPRRAASGMSRSAAGPNGYRAPTSPHRRFGSESQRVESGCRRRNLFPMICRNRPAAPINPSATLHYPNGCCKENNRRCRHPQPARSRGRARVDPMIPRPSISTMSRSGHQPTRGAIPTQRFGSASALPHHRHGPNACASAWRCSRLRPSAEVSANGYRRGSRGARRREIGCPARSWVW